MYVVQALCYCMCAKAIGLGHSTLNGFDPFELICAEPDPVSGGTRLAKYPSLCQPKGMGLEGNWRLKPQVVLVLCVVQQAQVLTHAEPSASKSFGPRGKRIVLSGPTWLHCGLVP